MVASLGLVNLIAGFLPEVSLPASARQVVQSTSVFAVGPGWVPLLLLIGGLLAVAAFLPGGGDHRFAAAAVSVAGAVGAVVALGIPNGFEQLLGAGLGNGAGALLLFVGGTIQAVVAVAALVLTGPGPTSGLFFGGSRQPGGPGSPAPAAVGPWSTGSSPSGSSPYAGDAAGFRPGGPAGPVQPGPGGSAQSWGPVSGALSRWDGAGPVGQRPPGPADGPGSGRFGAVSGPVPGAARSTAGAFGPDPSGFRRPGDADDLRDTGPIPVVRSDGPPSPSAGDRTGRHWAQPDDVTVSTRAQDRPTGSDAPDGP